MPNIQLALAIPDGLNPELLSGIAWVPLRQGRGK